MNNFAQRTLSSVIYAASVIFLTYYGEGIYSNLFGGVFAVLLLLALREFYTLLKVGRFQMIWSMVCGLCLYSAFWLQNTPILSAVGAMLTVPYVFFLVIGLIAELWTKAENPIANWGYLLISQMMIVLPFALLVSLMGYNHWLVMALFVIIWLNDAGAYCIGTLTAKLPGGNHKMFVRVSPKKSWEGLFGGIALAILTGYVISLINTEYSTIQWLIMATLVAIAANLGDLMESLFKRTIGVKDSGRFLPGHGGVLDRFDSLLLATPVLAGVILFNELFS